MGSHDLMDDWRSLRRRSFKEILLYIAVCALIIAAIFAAFAAGMDWDFFSKWVGLAIYTSVPFGYFIADSHVLWTKPAFWVFVAVCLSIHCAAWVVILLRVAHWKVIWFSPVLAEMVIVAFIRNWALRRPRRKKLHS